MIDPLQSELERIARRLDARRWNIFRATWWLLIAVAATGAITLQATGHPIPHAAVVLAGIAILGAFFLRQLQRHLRPDLREVAARIERRRPELQTALLAAIDQQPGQSGLGYLQHRVIEEALDSAATWDALAPTGHVQLSLWVRRIFLGTAALALAVLAGMSLPRAGKSSHLTGLVVQPGDAEIERGNPVTITVQFPRTTPGEAAVEFVDASGQTRSAPLRRTLDDPTFSTTLPALNESLRYRVVSDAGRSTDYTLTPFDPPRVAQMDAELHFPGYLERPPRRLEEVRRISAIEQTKLILKVRTNQPMRSVELHPAEGPAIALQRDPENPSLFRTAFPLAESGSYRVVVADEAGRHNDSADRFEIEVLRNKPPVITAKLPTRGERATPLQEVAIEATVRDDFGIRAAGLTVQVPGGETRNVLAEAVQVGGKSIPITTSLPLEDIGAKANDLLVWNAWAEDVGPDGLPRRTEGDLHIIPVRHFDERIQQQEASMTQAGEQRCLKCIRIQTEILNGTWSSLRQGADDGELSTLNESQKINLDLARAIEADLEDAALHSHAREAGEAMSRAIEALDPSNPDLEEAVRAEQAALAHLYRLLPPDSIVALGRSSSPNSGSPPTEDLELKDMKPRYEDETIAQAPLDARAREIRETLARLRDLAQRQHDLNEEINRMLQGLRVAKSDEERAEIDRRLQRLRDQQREVLEDIDRARRHIGDSYPQTAEASGPEALDQARDAAQQALQNLENRELGDALAEGGRAKRDLERGHDDFRQATAGELSERLRNLREKSREMGEAQQRLGEELRNPPARPSRPSLSAEADSFDTRAREQIERAARLMDDASATAQLAEDAEPLVARQLEEAVGSSREQLIRALEAMQGEAAVGNPEGARLAEQAAAREIAELRESIEQASSSILGSEKAALEYARAEIEDLRRAASPASSEGRSPADRPAEGSPSTSGKGDTEPSQQGQQNGSGEGMDSRMAGTSENGSVPVRTGSGSASRSSGGGSNLGSIGGESSEYQTWSDRLRNLEAMVDVPEAAALLSRARAAAREFRIASKRNSAPPSRELLERNVLRPLAEAETEIAHALQALDRNRDSLAPVERDPVPEKYSEIVQRYYESLAQ